MAQYELKDKGVYKGKILRHQIGATAKKVPFVELVFRLTEKENEETGEFEPVDGFTRSIQLFMSEKALPITRDNLEYLGYTDKSPARLVPTHKDAHNFAGIEVYLKCDEDEYNGKPKEKWNLQRRRKQLTPEEAEKLVAGISDDFEAAWEESQQPVEEAFAGTWK